MKTITKSAARAQAVNSTPGSLRLASLKNNQPTHIIKLLLFVILLTPMEAHLSGYQQVKLDSGNYSLTVGGGISSWEYDQIRERDQALKETLLLLKPQLDEAFSRLTKEQAVTTLLAPYNEEAIYIDGALIEPDADKDAGKAHHFNHYKSSSKNGLFFAYTDAVIPNTSFKATIQFTANDRIERSKVDAILEAQIAVLKNSPALMQQLY